MNNRDNKKEYDSLEKLTALDDGAVDEIAEKYPALDDAAFKRIEALCERKMNMNINTNNTAMPAMNMPENADRVEGVETIRHIPFYRRPVFAACASLVVLAAAGAAMLFTRTGLSCDPNIPDIPAPPAVGCTAATETSTEYSADATETTAADPEKHDHIGIVDATERAENNAATEDPAETDPTEDMTEDSAVHCVTNGFDLADYPMYYDYLVSAHESFPGHNFIFTLCDLDGNGSPELVRYTTAGGTDVRLILDTDMNFIIPESDSYITYLLDDNIILNMKWGDPDSSPCTFSKYAGNGVFDRMECLILGNSFDLKTGSMSINRYEGSYKAGSKYYVYELSENERRSTYPCAYDDIDILNSPANTEITEEQAEEIISKYRDNTIEHASLFALLGIEYDLPLGR